MARPKRKPQASKPYSDSGEHAKVRVESLLGKLALLCRNVPNDKNVTEN
jgi:hypothetical protein